MDCPKEISEIVLEILRGGIIRIRCEGSNGDAVRCEIEANHIHNFPNLLNDYHEEKLLYYYRVEIPNYVHRSEGVNIDSFRPAWGRLATYLELRRLDAK